MSTAAPVMVADRRSTAEISVVASDRAEDLDEALSIVHDGFVEAGFASPQRSGRRVHRSYLNPGTMFFVARMGGEAVGTCAFIADGPFGLPSDRAFVEENDAMREEGLGTLHECGSLAVRRDARRHTRRIVMRLMAAMTRLSAEEFPDEPMPLAVAPGNERFYDAIAGARPVAGPRPLYRAPAILLRTSGGGVARHNARGATPLQRRMHALITEPDPSWFHDARTHRPLPQEWLRALLEEQGTVQRLADQLDLLAERYPAAFEEIVPTGRAVAA